MSSVYVPEPGLDGMRRYGRAKACLPEDRKRCVMSVPPRGWQCHRYRSGDGLYCKQHARMMEVEK